MQVFSTSWTPPTGVLGRIVAEAKVRAAELRRGAGAAPDLELVAEGAPRVPSMVDALRAESVAVIAEVKRRSPSKGYINVWLSAAAQARAYEGGRAAAVSILTEPAHFGGSLADLEEARRATTLPLLRKDFHVDAVQLAEAKRAGASAVLLIARALAPAELVSLASAARQLALQFLVEVRNEDELERALAVDAPMIGVNNRDLETLVIDPAVSDRLIPLIPSGRIAIAESGVRGVADVERVAAIGADAVLVGSSISASSDPAAAVCALTGVRKTFRAR